MTTTNFTVSVHQEDLDKIADGQWLPSEAAREKVKANFKMESTPPKFRGVEGKWVKEWYIKRRHLHFQNIEAIRNQCPEKLARMICELVVNPFFITFASHKIKERYTSIESKLRFLAHSYERAYEYFGLIAVTSLGHQTVEQHATLDWWKLDTAVKTNNIPWHNNKNQKSGAQKWAIAHCDLFDNPLASSALLRDIRNAFSHDGIQFASDRSKIVLLEKNGKMVRELTVDQIKSLYSSTKAALFCAKDFMTEVIFLRGIWLEAYFYGITIRTELVERYKMLLDLLKKEKRKEKLNIDSFFNDSAPILLELASWTNHGLWQDLLSKKPVIDKILFTQGYALLDTDIEQATDGIKEGFTTAFHAFCKMLPKDFVKKYEAIDIESRDKNQLIKELSEELAKYESGQASVLTGLFLGLGIILINPLKILFKDIPCKVKPLPVLH